MSLSALVSVTSWIFLAYFAGLNLVYLCLNFISLSAILHDRRHRLPPELDRLYSGLEPPISLLVPAYNEETTIVASIRSMLQLSYPQLEIVIINDGSKDGTLDVLKQELSLVPFPEAYRVRIPTMQVRGIYRSTVHENLRVIDKENGGKADSLNAGINATRYPLFCGVDADSVVQRDSLRRLAACFMDDPNVIAAGGTVRIANGCRVAGGFLESIDLPRNPLALFQIVEYLRAFLFGRMGWSPLNAMLIISGAFGVFRKEAVIEAGGYRTDTVGEDMELVVRLHRLRRAARQSCRIVFVPDPICWTEAPEDLGTLRNQRIRWQRGLLESLWFNRSLLFHPRGGAAGWVAFPVMLVFEGIGPLIEVAGYVFMLSGWLSGLVSGTAFLIFMLLALGLGFLLSASGLLLEQITFHAYPKASQLLRLVAGLAGENLGYRQLNSWWRLVGVWRWLRGTRHGWGNMKRKGSWQKA